MDGDVRDSEDENEDERKRQHDEPGGESLQPPANREAAQPSEGKANSGAGGDSGPPRDSSLVARLVTNLVMHKN